MDTEAVGRALLILGAVIVVVGLGVLLLAKVGFAGLPGDISVRRPGFIFHFPVVTMIWFGSPVMSLSSRGFGVGS